MEGWIRLYRKFDEWEWFNVSEMVHLFIYLLLNANNEDAEWHGIQVKRGQIITGLYSLNSKTKISIRKLRTCLDRLKKTGEIDIQTTNKYSIITINKYDTYQYKYIEADKQIDKQPTNKRQANDNKQEYTEEKNNTTWRSDFNIYLAECRQGYKAFMETPELIKIQEKLNPGVNIKLTIEKGFINYWGTEAGWQKKKSKRIKVINWKSTIINSIAFNKVYYTKSELAAKC